MDPGMHVGTRRCGLQLLTASGRSASLRAVAGLRRAGPLVALLVGAGLLLFSSSSASARHNFSMLEVADQVVGAGTEVGVSGFSYTATAYIRFGQIDGPVLATLEPSDDDVISGTVRIPESAAAGRYVLYAVQQNEAGKPNRFPGKAALTVVEPGGPPLEAVSATEPEVRPAGFVLADPFSLGDFLSIALATVGVMSLLTMAIYRFAWRRRSTPVGQHR
jgi:hypothetical protein